ncbi:MAG: DUF899 family protein [Pseudomonadota bacterium]
MDNNIVTRDEWLQARAALRAEEKALTAARAALAAKRRALPWVRVMEAYRFLGPEGEATLVDLFAQQSQLLVYHFMLGPGWEAPCPGCSQWAAAIHGTATQFARADARLVVISRAPLAEIERVQRQMGWDFDWYSSFESRFNYDFFVSNEDQGKDSSVDITASDGTAERVFFDRGENHGVSVFVKNAAGEVCHAYSAYNRGIEELNGAMGYLDLLPKGRTW